MSHNTSLLLITLLGIAGLVVLVTQVKLNAFLALVIASLFVGLCSGMNPADIPKGFLEGMGGVLGSIAAVVGLGTILGKLLAESGGAEVIARQERAIQRRIERRSGRDACWSERSK